jgi:hypothetical protein
MRLPGARTVAGVCVSLAIAFIAFECLALLVFYIEHRELYYTREPAASPPDRIEFTDARVHPYFGFVRQPFRPDPHYPTNNYGFDSPTDYPYRKKDRREFIIGVFGGSVAHNFAFASAQRFVEDLERQPFFEGRDLVVLNFAWGGYKQPQQLQILSYFLAVGQQFDLVVNLDGFNDTALSYINFENGVDIAMPSHDHMSQLLALMNAGASPRETLHAMAQMVDSRDAMRDLARRRDHSALASVYLLRDAHWAVLSRRYRKAVVAVSRVEPWKTEGSIMIMNPLPPTCTTDNVFEQVAELWARCSILMARQLAVNGIPYLHILQPNQYYSIRYSKRTFSDAETAVAFQSDSRYRQGVEKGYPLLLAKSDSLRNCGVDFISAVDLFDREPRAVYGDNCCHYNALGDVLLADFAAAAVVSHLNRPVPRRPTSGSHP